MAFRREPLLEELALLDPALAQYRAINFDEHPVAHFHCGLQFQRTASFSVCFDPSIRRVITSLYDMPALPSLESASLFSWPMAMVVSLRVCCMLQYA